MILRQFEPLPLLQSITHDVGTIQQAKSNAVCYRAHAQQLMGIKHESGASSVSRLLCCAVGQGERSQSLWPSPPSLDQRVHVDDKVIGRIKRHRTKYQS